MKKQTIQLLVLTAVLVTAVTGLLLLHKSDTPVQQETSTDPILYALGGTAKPLVKQVSIQNQIDAYTIIHHAASQPAEQASTASAYSLEQLDNDTLNETLLESTLNTLAALPAKRMVVESDEDFPLYGLDQPRATVAITYADNSATLLIGDPASGQAGVYVAVDQTVFLVEESYIASLLGGRLDFVSKTITPGNTQSTTFQSITLSGSMYESPIVLERMTNTETETARYQITAPIAALADEEAIASLSGIYGLFAVKVVDIAAFQSDAAAAYGLDTPYLQAEVTTFENITPSGTAAIDPFTMIFSKPDESGLLYAQSNRQPYVYQLSRSALPFFSLELFDYQEKQILMPEIDSVSEIEIQAATGQTYRFVLEGEGDALQVSLDGKTLDTANFRKFYQTLTAARYVSEITPESIEQAEENTASPPPGVAIESPSLGILLQYTYHYRNESPEHVLQFLSGPPRKSMVALDGGQAYYTQSAYVDRVLEDLPKVSADETVQAYA